MRIKGGCTPTREEAAAKASRVELYECRDCAAETRFPRYNDPAKLLETRNVSTGCSSGSRSQLLHYCCSLSCFEVREKFLVCLNRFSCCRSELGASFLAPR